MMAELVAAFVVGAVCGALIVVGFLADRDRVHIDPTEHGGNPL